MRRTTVLFLALIVLSLTQCKKEDLTEKVIGNYALVNNGEPEYEYAKISKVDNNTISIVFGSSHYGDGETYPAKMNSKTDFTLSKTTVIDNATGYRHEDYGNGFLSGENISITIHYDLYQHSNDSLIVATQGTVTGTKQ